MLGGVNSFQEQSGVRAADLEPAQRADVDHSGPIADGAHLGRDRGLAPIACTVEGGPVPEPGRHHSSPQPQMLVVHGREPRRRDAAAGEVAEALGQERRALRGGGTDRVGAERARPAQDAQGIDGRVAALARTHRDRGVALGELGVVESFSQGVAQVARGLVLVEVDEVLAVGVREDWPGVAMALGRPGRARDTTRGRGPGGSAVGQHGGEVMAMGDRPGQPHALRLPLEPEARQGVIVDEPRAGAAGELAERRHPRRSYEEIAGHRNTVPGASRPHL